MTAGWYRPGAADRLPQAQVIAELARAQVVLLGEQHDRAEIHRWQMHVAAGLLAHRPIVMGFEMFPARLDPVLADWVAGGLDEATFLKRAEWEEVWGFPAELYLPIFRFCRENAVPMIGLNCRRGLVREVGRGGWDAVPERDREGLTPARPSPLPYRRFIFDLTGGARPDREAKGPEDPAFDRFLRAQEVWDRAFATRIAAVATAAEAPLVVGIIGQGHLQWGGGVSWQIRDFGVEAVTVALPQASGAPALDKGAADFVQVLPV